MVKVRETQENSEKKNCCFRVWSTLNCVCGSRHRMRAPIRLKAPILCKLVLCPVKSPAGSVNGLLSNVSIERWRFFVFYLLLWLTIHRLHRRRLISKWEFQWIALKVPSYVMKTFGIYERHLKELHLLSDSLTWRSWLHRRYVRVRFWDIWHPSLSLQLLLLIVTSFVRTTVWKY